MNLLTVRNRIAELMAVFVAQIKTAGVLNQYDINKVAEQVLIPLLSAVYGFNHLKNLNTSEQQNYPGIDLADDVAKVAFQVTSTSNSSKVQDTLRQFVAHELFTRYATLYIYVLTEKQQSYATDSFNSIVSGRFAFSPKEHIRDFSDVLRTVASFQIDQARRVLRVLEANFGDPDTPILATRPSDRTEIGYLNLIEIGFPASLFLAELLTTNKKPKRTRRYGKDQRKQVQDALAKRGLKFSVDWVFHEGQVVTFHDLSDNTLPISQVVDVGTVTMMPAEEYYGLNVDYERVFKSLLGRCLQQKLFRRQVLWQHEDKLFIFGEVDGKDVRIEKWQSTRENERVVFERTMKSNKPDEILNCKHLGFRTEYRRIGQHWYIQIQPDWFFSFDGYRRSFYGAKNIAWLKRKENNSHVLNHLLFLASFLRDDSQPSLLDNQPPYQFLTIGSPVRFEELPFLDDNAWNPTDDESEDEGDANLGQLTLDI
jgi:hypothetical protein